MPDIGLLLFAAAAILNPAETISAADASPQGRVSGRCELTVASANRPRSITFLNSAVDFRAPGNVSFSLAPMVGAALAKRLGGAPVKMLLHRRITVDGTVSRDPIYGAERGHLPSFSRWAYTVRVERIDQIVAIDGVPMDPARGE